MINDKNTKQENKSEEESLTDTDIGPEEAIVLSKALSMNTTLTDLNLAGTMTVE